MKRGHERASATKRNVVRIIGGAWRGRRVQFPQVPGLRPTPDRVRETLFNWLQHEIPGSRCLDLFAGSGVLGLEALSRGACEAIFVEQSPIAARMLRTEIERLGGADRSRIVEGDALDFLRQPAEAYDVLFLDPPFGQGKLAQYVRLLDEHPWIASSGWVYLECERTLGAPDLPPNWTLYRSKSAGEVGYHLARVSARGGP